jgi:hypothetical protein
MTMRLRGVDLRRSRAAGPPRPSMRQYLRFAREPRAETRPTDVANSEVDNSIDVTPQYVEERLVPTADRPVSTGGGRY